ncbi:uncharacterized protein LOC100902637 [Galendromus occidentalis]|uniref:Uncharacterized protein LOC100902637 n=1 Tax=Galendromus occidentalis TaxID=34638 RepID=A0AAJ6QSR4_9ACAR|nr:uncharacterized protein LOC100902637 [Galendromus occidentalis]
MTACPVKVPGLISAYLTSWNHLMGPQMLFCWQIECSETNTAVAKDLGGHAKCQDSHYLKCHQYLENSEAFILENRVPQYNKYLNEANVEAPYTANIVQLMHGYLEHCRLRKDPWPTRTVILIASDKKVVVHGVTFTLPSSTKSLGVSLVFDLDCVWDLYNIINLTDTTLIRIAHICMQAGDQFLRCINQVTTLLNRYFSLAAEVLETRFIDRKSSSVALAKWCAKEADLMKKLLQAHFTNGGYTALIGGSKENMQSLVEAMCAVLTHCELNQAVLTPQLSFYPGLHLQSVMRDTANPSPAVSQLSTKELSFSPTPCVIVDMDNPRVLRSLISMDAKSQVQANKKLKSVKGPSGDSVVEKFVSELQKLVSANEAQIEMVVRRYISYFWGKGASLVAMIRRSKAPLTREQCGAYLNVSPTSDLDVILAFAEKIQPGSTKLLKSKGTS